MGKKKRVRISDLTDEELIASIVYKFSHEGHNYIEDIRGRVRTPIGGTAYLWAYIAGHNNQRWLVKTSPVMQHCEMPRKHIAITPLMNHQECMAAARKLLSFQPQPQL